jgi:hypothetical protein
MGGGCAKASEVFVEATALLLERVEHVVENTVCILHALHPSLGSSWDKMSDYSRADG